MTRHIELAQGILDGHIGLAQLVAVHNRSPSAYLAIECRTPAPVLIQHRNTTPPRSKLVLIGRQFSRLAIIEGPAILDLQFPRLATLGGDHDCAILGEASI